jgi:tRNA threonylcarbamoyladenosine biosynthesis protein TsaB
MTILALEFSSAQRSVAVLDLMEGSPSPPPKKDGALTKQYPPENMAEVVETGGRGTNAFGMVEKVLAEAKIEREQIEVIAVGLGPGSYTGIRVALSVAQGWQLARDVKLLGVSSIECLAAQAQAEKWFGRVNVIIDAQRNEFYLAAYEISSRGWKEIKPLQITALTGIQSRANAGEIWVGPEVTRWLPKGKTLFPSAAALVRLAVKRSDFVSGDKLTPIYLRETNFVKAPPPNSVAL